MIVKTHLADIQEELARDFEYVSLKGQGSSSFLHVTHNGRGVEISENEGSFWLEFWERSDDEDAASVKEITVKGGDRAISETRRWLI